MRLSCAGPFLLLAASLWAQTPAPGAPQDLPKVIITVGGGFASPNGKFAYVSESSLILPQGTYATISQEYSIIKGVVVSCTFAGATKPMYTFSIVTIGITGLGGGCNSTNGDTSGAGSAQGFLHFKWGHLPFGNVITAQKNSNSGFKITLGFTGQK